MTFLNLFLSFAVLVRILSNSFSNVFQKKLAEIGFNPMLINFVMYAGLSLLSLPVILRLNFYEISGCFWLYSVLGGLFGALGNSYLIKALKNGELSVLGPINAYKSVVAMVIGIFLLNEIPSFIGIFGVLLIIIGSYIVFDTQQEGFSLSLFKRADIRYRFYALFFTAIEALCIKNVINESNVYISFAMWCLFGMFFCWIFSFNNMKSNKKTTKKSILYLLMVVICMGIMQLSTNYVFSHLQVSYGLALFQLSAIISVLLGWRLFNECNISKKLFGTAIMILGAIIIILYK